MSAGSSFTTVLSQLSQLHKKEINELKEQLDHQYQVNEEQRKEIQQLREWNQRLQLVVSTAKKKIRQYKHSQQTPEGEEMTLEDLSDVSSPTVLFPTQHTRQVVKDTPFLNKTCAALFESPSVSEQDHKTPTRQVHGRSGDFENDRLGDRTETAVLDLKRGESVETNVGSCDVVIIEGDKSPVLENSSNVQNENGSADVSNSSENTSISVTMDSEEEPVTQSDGGSEDVGYQDDAPIHMFYAHAQPSELQDKMLTTDLSEYLSSPSKLRNSPSAGRSLTLRGKVRYTTVSEKSSHQQSSRSNSTRTTSNGTNSLSNASQGSLETDTESDDSSSSDQSNSSSPSLLLNTSSHYPPSHHPPQGTPTKTPQHEPMTCSLFPSTPVPLSPVSGNVTITTPATGREIPKSDSQLSLDMSQSIPFSPELKDPFFPQPTSSVLAQQTNHSSVENKKSSDVKPSVHGEKTSPNRPLSLGRRKAPSNKMVIRERGKDASNNHITSLLNKKSSPKNILPITPGVKSVNNILEKTSAWMGVHHSKTHHELQDDLTTRTTSRPSHGKHTSSTTEEDLEEVIPSKRAHLALALPRDRGTKRKDRTTLKLLSQLASQGEVEGNDETRMVGEAGHEEKLTFSELETQMENKMTTSHHIQDNHEDYAKRLAERAGLPGGYKFVNVVRKKADRDKLDAKPCPDCEAWYNEADGIHDDQRQHLKHTCRHKHLHLPPDTDPRLWDISFPNTEECEQLMRNDVD